MGGSISQKGFTMEARDNSYRVSTNQRVSTYCTVWVFQRGTVFNQQVLLRLQLRFQTGYRLLFALYLKF